MKERQKEKKLKKKRLHFERASVDVKKEEEDIHVFNNAYLGFFSKWARRRGGPVCS